MAGQKERYLQDLAKQLEGINDIKTKGFSSVEFLSWRTKTLLLIEKYSGTDSGYAQKFDAITTHTNKSKSHSKLLNAKSFERTLETAKVLLLIILEDRKIENHTTHDLQEGAQDFVVRLCTRFPRIVHQLGKEYRGRRIHEIEDEYDLQHIFHSLLLMNFDDVRPEDVNPSYAGATSRVDFLLKQEKIVIEVKKTRSSLRDKEVGEQLIVDIGRYSSNPDCRVLICFVYDPEKLLSNPVALENDLSRVHENIDVNVIVEPKT